VALSPQANYTDRVTATCRRNFSANFCVLYTTYLPTSIHTTTGTFADDTVILARHDDPVTASHKLQDHLDQLEVWLK
jgi:hypothetical protein